MLALTLALTLLALSVTFAFMFAPVVTSPAPVPRFPFSPVILWPLCRFTLSSSHTLVAAAAAAAATVTTAVAVLVSPTPLILPLVNFQRRSTVRNPDICVTDRIDQRQAWIKMRRCLSITRNLFQPLNSRELSFLRTHET